MPRIFEARVSLLLLVILLGAATPQAFACRCPQPFPPSAAYRRAHVVVQAKVINLKPGPRAGGSTAELQVFSAWKQGTASQIQIETRTTCAFPFEPGREYLLFLYRNPEGGYYTSRCVGNEQADKAGPALEWLKKHGTAERVE